MIFGIYDPPDSSIKPWPDLRVGAIVNATDFEYEKHFCGVGNFELYVPICSADADKLKLNRLLFSVDGGFIIKKVQYGVDNITVSGHDLNGLLLERLTVANTEDGKDKITGSTETIVKHFVNKNCALEADAARQFPGLKVKTDRNRGIANDAASPRLEIVADVISDILSAQQMGWRISAVNLTESSASISTRFEFEVFNAVDRTATGTRPKTFSYGLGNADAIKTENSIAGAKNTLYCELDDGTVQTYSPVSNNVGFARTEEYADLGCELSELSVYAKHEIADRFAEVQSVTLEHVDASGFGADTLEGFDLGDIVTVVDNNADVKLEALISSVKIKRSGENELEFSTENNINNTNSINNAHELSITVGEARTKPLDRVSKTVDAVSKNTKETTAQVREKFPAQAQQISALKNRVFVLEGKPGTSNELVASNGSKFGIYDLGTDGASLAYYDPEKSVAEFWFLGHPQTDITKEVVTKEILMTGATHACVRRRVYSPLFVLAGAIQVDVVLEEITYPESHGGLRVRFAMGPCNSGFYFIDHTYTTAGWDKYLEDMEVNYDG